MATMIRKRAEGIMSSGFLRQVDFPANPFASGKPWATTKRQVYIHSESIAVLSLAVFGNFITHFRHIVGSCFGSRWFSVRVSGWAVFRIGIGGSGSHF